MVSIKINVMYAFHSVCALNLSKWPRIEGHCGAVTVTDLILNAHTQSCKVRSRHSATVPEFKIRLFAITPFIRVHFFLETPFDRQPNESQKYFNS